MTLSVADRLEIQDLMGRFALAVDVDGPDAYRDIFVEDSRFVIDDFQLDLHGRETIIQWVKDNAESFPPGLNHVQSNFVIDGDDGEARVRCISQAIQSHEGEIKLFVIGRYDETLVKTDKGWRLKIHRLNVQA